MKIRLKTWYWGNYIISKSKIIPRDFELYIEELHGWEHSEEFKSGYRLIPYNNN